MTNLDNDVPRDSLKSALRAGFVWEDSPEGLEFWYNVAEDVNPCSKFL